MVILKMSEQHKSEREDDTPHPPPPPSPPRDGMSSVGSTPPHPSLKAMESAPPTLELAEKPKRVEYRELFALFHRQDDDPIEANETWDTMYQLASADAREEYRLQLLERKKQRKPGAHADLSTPSRGANTRTNASMNSSTNSNSSSNINSLLNSTDKRARPPAPNDSDPNKAMRLNRQQTAKPKSSKLMQKLSSRGI